LLIRFKCHRQIDGCAEQMGSTGRSFEDCLPESPSFFEWQKSIRISVTALIAWLAVPEGGRILPFIGHAF
jgi:hypothetical protein